MNYISIRWRLFIIQILINRRINRLFCLIVNELEAAREVSIIEFFTRHRLRDFCQLVVTEVELGQVGQLRGKWIDVARQLVTHHVELSQRRVRCTVSQQRGKVGLDMVIAQVHHLDTRKQEQRVGQLTLQTLTTEVNLCDVVANGQDTKPLTHRTMVIGEVPRLFPVLTVEGAIEVLQDGKVEVVQHIALEETTNLLEFLPDICLLIKVNGIFGNFQYTILTIVQVPRITLRRHSGIDAQQLQRVTIVEEGKVGNGRIVLVTSQVSLFQVLTPCSNVGAWLITLDTVWNTE